MAHSRDWHVMLSTGWLLGLLSEKATHAPCLVVWFWERVSQESSFWERGSGGWQSSKRLEPELAEHHFCLLGYAVTGARFKMKKNKLPFSTGKMIKILWPCLVHCNLLLVFRSTIFFGCLGHFGCHDIWYLSSTSFTNLAPVPLSSSASKLAISFPFFCLYLDLRLCNISNQRLHLIFDFSYQVNTTVCLLICSRKFSLSSNKIRSFSIKPSNRGAGVLWL